MSDPGAPARAGASATAASPAVAAALEAAPRTADSRPTDGALVLWMLLLTALWGLNAVSIKVLLGGLAPIMGAALRNLAALGVLAAFGLWRGERFSLRGVPAGHGALNGLLFAAEFFCSYSGARLTNAGHFALFINFSPFVVACGAHFLFALERMHALKALGLVGALGGLALMFSDDLLVQGQGFWRGDLLVLTAAVFWGSNTLHAKRFILGRMSAFQLLVIKLLVSTPLLLALSWWLEPAPFAGFSGLTALMLAYQSVIVVAFSYQMLTVLLHRYMASSVQSFTFMTPVWGVVLGIVLLGERLTPLLAGGMALVALGLYLITRPRRALP